MKQGGLPFFLYKGRIFLPIGKERSVFVFELAFLVECHHDETTDACHDSARAYRCGRHSAFSWE